MTLRNTAKRKHSEMRNTNRHELARIFTNKNLTLAPELFV
jgi:hypothetical protein